MITDKGVAVPDDMAAVLQAIAEALTAFDAASADDQRVYVDWVRAQPARRNGRSGSPGSASTCVPTSVGRPRTIHRTRSAGPEGTACAAESRLDRT